MTETTLATPTSTPRPESPKRILMLMAAAVAVSGAIALGATTDHRPAAVVAVVDPRVDYAIRHLDEGRPAEVTPRNVDYALRHMKPEPNRNVDYALRHLDR